MELDQLCYLFDLLKVTEDSCVPCEEEDLLCRVFDCLNISDDVCIVPTIYTISAVGYSRITSMGHEVWGLSFFPKSKGTDQTRIGIQALFWTQRVSDKLWLWKRQLQKDFYLFFCYFKVRKKNNCFAFGFLKDQQRWVGIYFYILWRYRSNESAYVLLLESSSIKLRGLIFFYVDDSNRYLVCVCDVVIIIAVYRDHYLHGELLRQVEELEEIHFMDLSNREIGCVVIRGWYLRRVRCSQTRVIDWLNLVDVPVVQIVLKNILMSRVKSHRSRLLSWVMLHRSKLSYHHEGWWVVTVNGHVTEILLPEMLLPEIMLPMILAFKILLPEKCHRVNVENRFYDSSPVFLFFLSVL